jgi:tetratricopeptide (TPR) repeat protein
VTKSNWEGVGVIPNVEVSEDLALEKAKALAAEEAKKYKESSFAPLLKALDAPVSLDHEQIIQQHLKQLVAKSMLDENDINRLGYNYFLAGKKDAALVIFKANTLFYPDSPNVFDSYAEVLGELGQTEEALKNFREAITLAKAQNHSNLDAFQQNLAAFEQKKR